MKIKYPTLTELLFAIRSQDSSTKTQVLGALYFLQDGPDAPGLSVRDLRVALIQARLPGAKSLDLYHILVRAAPLVESVGTGNSLKWRLTQTGLHHMSGLIPGIATVKQGSHLRNLLAQVGDPQVRSYIEEAIACLEVGASRACVVFLWAGAIRTIELALLRATPDVTALVQKHDPKTRSVRTIEDFAYVKDHLTLVVAEDAGLLDKAQRTMLSHALDLRNHCGHPSVYRPGSARVEAFIEDVAQIVFEIAPSP